jgi:hypothetical protein
MKYPLCERHDHPSDPHFHYGYGDRYWSRDFPHWDVDATSRLYAKQEWNREQVHPDMDVDAGWTA